MKDYLGDLFGADAAGTTRPAPRSAGLRRASYTTEARAVRRAAPVPAGEGLPRYTVSELVGSVERILKGGFPGRVVVTGEIATMNRAASGHSYFSVKDSRAMFSCVVFRGALEEGEIPRVGEMVELEGEVSTYAPRGSVQLKVFAIRPAGAGALHAAFVRLKAALEKEGLFRAERKRPVAPIPRVIGVVTSLKTAALRDVLKTLLRRAPYARIIVYPTPVQGAEAPARIVRALAAAGRHGRADVLLLVRGGGSFEDLNCFNSEAVARAIAACPVPVITGIGHESDTTIADLVADMRAETPTAAAERCATGVAELLQGLERAGGILSRAMEDLLQQQGQRLDILDRSLVSPGERLATERERVRAQQERLARFRKAFLESGESALRECGRRLRDALGKRVSAEESRLFQAQSRLQSPGGRLEAERVRTDALRDRLVKSGRGRLGDALGGLQKCALRLQAAQRLRISEEASRLERAQGRLGAVHPDTGGASQAVRLHAAALRHAARLRLEQLWGVFERTETRFLALDFQKTLERGFAILEKEGVRLASVGKLAPGDRVHAILADGESQMQVVSVTRRKRAQRRRPASGRQAVRSGSRRTG